MAGIPEVHAKGKTLSSVHNMGDQPDDRYASGGSLHAHTARRTKGGHANAAGGGDMNGRDKHAAGGATKVDGIARPKRADGGKAGDIAKHKAANSEKVHTYNAEGSPTVKEAADEDPEFDRGGKVRSKRKDGGGLATGGLAANRADRPRRAVGGGTPPARSPYTQAHMLSSPNDAKNSRGYEGDGPA